MGHPRTTEYGYKSYRLQNGGTGAIDSRYTKAASANQYCFYAQILLWML